MKERISSSSNDILFDLSKQSTVADISNVQNEIKFLQKRLKLKGWKITINKDNLGLDMLNKFALIIIYMPKLKYNELEFSALKIYLENEGKIFILLEEGGERKSLTNINYFIEDYGVSVNNDRVIRTSFYKYYNPKEVLIQDGIINRTLVQYANKQSVNATNKTISYIYPYGATLNVVKPSIPVLSTGTTSFPSCRPTCSFYQNKNLGKMIVLGSGQFLADKFINKENNLALLDLFFSFFTEASFSLNSVDSLNPEISDYNMVPDLEILCNNPMLFLEENEEIPVDYSNLFSKEIKKISNRSLSQVNKTFDEFQVEKRPLRLIKPYFETPLPSLLHTVFPPVFRSLVKPELELYDLDDEFSSIQNKLTKLANKCNNNDIDYFIRESGLTIGLNLNYSDNVSKSILHAVVSKIVICKQINSE